VKELLIYTIIPHLPYLFQKYGGTAFMACLSCRNWGFDSQIRNGVVWRGSHDRFPYKWNQGALYETAFIILIDITVT